MGLVVVDGFFTHGVNYARGDELPEDVIAAMPQQVLKIHMDNRALMSATPEEAKAMREDRDLKAETAGTDAKKNQAVRTYEKIVEMKARLKSNEGNRKSNELALGVLETRLQALVPPPPSPEPPEDLDATEPSMEPAVMAAEERKKLDDKPKPRGRGRG